MCFHPEIIYVVPAPVFEDHHRLVGNGLFPCSPGWRRACGDRERVAIDRGDEDEARHWHMVLEFGFRYGCNAAAAIEVDGRLFREFELPFDIPAHALKRIVIGAKPFNLDDVEHRPLRLSTDARP